MYKYSIFETPYGFMSAVASERGLHMITLPRKKIEEVRGELKRHYLELLREEEGLKGLARKFQEYFEGQPVEFRIRMDLIGATPFELKVWDVTMGIPRGQVRSYEWVAKQVGNKKEVRAVGQALSRNRLPVIIPCHRVIRKEGDLGGFSAGVQMKRLLLKIEGYLIC
jgi:methylated-DNA-[protein]-cysteine S-methyltransferase